MNKKFRYFLPIVFFGYSTVRFTYLAIWNWKNPSPDGISYGIPISLLFAAASFVIFIHLVKRKLLLDKS